MPDRLMDAMERFAWTQAGLSENSGTRRFPVSLLMQAVPTDKKRVKQYVIMALLRTWCPAPPLPGVRVLPLPGDRLVFNIKGNAYRLVVIVEYSQDKMFIRFVGAHSEYDRIDAATI